MKNIFLFIGGFLSCSIIVILFMSLNIYPFSNDENNKEKTEVENINKEKDQTKNPAAEDSSLIENEEQDIPNEEDNNTDNIKDIDNLDWLIGKWMDGTERYFVKEAEIKKIDGNYYINVVCMFHRRFPLAQTDDLLLIFDESTASAYYEDDEGGNRGHIYLYIDENNKLFSMKVEETYSNGTTVKKVSTLDSTLEMISYEEPKIQQYNYSAGLDKFYDLVDYMQSNIWFSNDSSSIEWAFVPNRISLGDGYLYEDGKFIGRYLINEQSDINNNELSIILELNSLAQNKNGKIIFANELMEIIFDDSEEALVFNSVLDAELEENN